MTTKKVFIVLLVCGILAFSGCQDTNSKDDIIDAGHKLIVQQKEVIRIQDEIIKNHKIIKYEFQKLKERVEKLKNPEQMKGQTNA